MKVNDIIGKEAAKEGIKNARGHVENAIKYILPFIIAGGILTVLAFILDNQEINPLNFGMNTTGAAFLKVIGEIAFGFILCILSGYIAKSIAGKEGWAVGIVGGVIASKGLTIQAALNPNAQLVSSGFVGAVIAGFVAGYVIVLLKMLCEKLPAKMESSKETVIYPLLGIVLVSIIIALINPVMTRINIVCGTLLRSLNTGNKIMLGIFLGAMMSIDFGGPISKAANVFAMGLIGDGLYDIMASVMAGAMVAPLAIAVLATIKPKKFQKEERKIAIANYLFGLAGVSEGVIPFVLLDPIKVIVSCAIGSAVAGGLAMAFNCGMKVPYGGIFAISSIDHVLSLLLAVLIGTIISAVLMGILKKKSYEE